MMLLIIIKTFWIAHFEMFISLSIQNSSFEIRIFVHINEEHVKMIILSGKTIPLIIIKWLHSFGDFVKELIRRKSTIMHIYDEVQSPKENNYNSVVGSPRLLNWKLNTMRQVFFARNWAFQLDKKWFHFEIFQSQKYFNLFLHHSFWLSA